MPTIFSRATFRSEACLFWTLVAAHLVPIWAFRYIPTQDGPAHLNGAIILKNYGSPDTRYSEFFELRLEATPNWTSHLLLAGLMFLFPPLVAEKILVSGYILAWAGSLRYFCGAFGGRTRPLALVGLLFVYNRCFWLGFWNFGFSLAACWWVLGFWLRRRDRSDMVTFAILSLMLVATFLTHLAGLLLTAAALLWFAVTAPVHRWRNLGGVIVACLPAAFLAMDYFDRTRFFGVGGSNRLRDHIGQWLHGDGFWTRLGQDLPALDNEFFAHHVPDSVPMGLIALALFTVLIVIAILTGKTSDDEPPAPPRWPAAVLALLFGVGYLLTPMHLSMEHGGFLKCRIALLPPLVLLACLREPLGPAGAWMVRALIALVLAGNLACVLQRVAADNEELAEYTAGREVVGSGKTLFVVQELQQAGRGGRPALADPLLHASQYYCLGTNNLNLDNYQATTRHFPLRFRDGYTRGRGIFGWYDRPQDVDVIIAWQAGPHPGIPPSFASAFRQGRLEVFVRR